MCSPQTRKLNKVKELVYNLNYKHFSKHKTISTRQFRFLKSNPNNVKQITYNAFFSAVSLTLSMSSCRSIVLAFKPFVATILIINGIYFAASSLKFY